MTKDQIRAANRRFVEKKRQLGWKGVSYFVPQEVYNELQKFKALKMQEYRAGQVN